MCRKDRQEQKTLLYHQKVARSQGLPAKIKGKTLYIEDRPFSVEKLIELENQGINITDSESEEAEDQSNFPNHKTEELANGSLPKNNLPEHQSQKRKRRKINYSPKTTGANIITRSQTTKTQKDT